MIREKITDPWREVSLGRGDRPRRRPSSSASRRNTGAARSAASPRRAAPTRKPTWCRSWSAPAFGNNNVDTCARVCHSPTGYGLSTTFGTSAGTQDFNSVEQTDVIMVIGANPTDAHPVFASRMKKRLREGAKLIVIDPRRIDLVRTPHVEAAYHLPLQPGTNVAVLTALAHVIVTEGLVNEAFVRERCDWDEFSDWARVRRRAAQQPGSGGEGLRRAGRSDPRRGAALCHRRQRRDLLRPRRHRAQPGLDHGDGDRQSRHGDRQYRPAGRRRESAARPEQRAGLLRHGLVPARALRLSPHLRRRDARDVRERCGASPLDKEPGLRIPNMLDAAVDGTFKGLYIQGEDILQSDPDTQHVAAGLAAMECVVVQDLFLNETANYAHVFLPGSTFLEKDGTFTNAERRIQRVRKVMAPKNGYADWEITLTARQGAWAIRCTTAIRREIMDEIARLTPTFAGVSYDEARRARLGAVAVQRQGAGGHAGHAYRRLRARQGQVHHHRICADRREDRPALPAAADHRPHPQPVQCRRADAAHRERRSGTRRTCSKSIRTTPSSAASATATG